MMGTEQITSVSSEPNTTIEKPVTKPKFPESMERIINKNAFPWNARDIEAREIPESPGEFIAGMSIGPTSILIRVNGE